MLDLEGIEGLARRTLRPLLAGDRATYPVALFAGSGLAGFGLPREAGGAGASAQDIFTAARILVREGLNMGFATGWLAHTQMARHFLMAHGNKAQQERWLPELASGKRMGAMAMSELKAGAHPKYLTTRARETAGGFLLNGEKAYTTNGPLAGLYAVLAISDDEGGRKRYSVFLVPRETPGLTQTEAGKVDYLAPATHGGISLKDCFVPSDALLGVRGQAYELMAKPLRASEDSFGISVRLGALEAQMTDMARAILSQPVDDAFKEAFGRLSFLVKTIEMLGSLAVDQVARNADAVALVTAARALTGQAAEIIDALKVCLPENSDLAQLCEDMAKATHVARAARRERERQEGAAALERMSVSST